MRVGELTTRVSGTLACHRCDSCVFCQTLTEIVVKMTPPLSWHFLQDENGRIQIMKNGKESGNGYVTSVKCCEKGGKVALRVSFTDLINT